MNSQDGFSSRPRKPEGGSRLGGRPAPAKSPRIPTRWKVIYTLVALFVLVASMHEEILGFVRGFLPKTATVVLIDRSENVVPLAGRADVFPLDRSVYLPSPRPKLASIALDDLGEELVLDSSRFPSSLQVRFHVPGYGVDFLSVDLGREKTYRLRLRSAVEFSGVVRGPDGEGVAGVRVLALGGDPRGVLLSEATTDAEGVYRIRGLSELAHPLLLRVLKKGYAIAEREYHPEAASYESLSKTDFLISPALASRGHIVLPPNLASIPGLRVSVRALPGVFADVQEDGSFELHHLEEGRRYRLLLQGLPETHTHGIVYAHPGEDIEIEVLPAVTMRGRVLLEKGGRAVAQVEVWHENSNRGMERAITDGTGHFVLRSVPRGAVHLNVAVPPGVVAKDGFASVREIQTPAAPDEPAVILLR